MFRLINQFMFPLQNHVATPWKSREGEVWNLLPSGWLIQCVQIKETHRIPSRAAVVALMLLIGYQRKPSPEAAIWINSQGWELPWYLKKEILLQGIHMQMRQWFNIAKFERMGKINNTVLWKFCYSPVEMKEIIVWGGRQKGMGDRPASQCIFSQGDNGVFVEVLICCITRWDR